MRQDQLQHFDALDGKAGVLLGFAGAVVALGSSRPGFWVFGGLLATASALNSVRAFMPRKYPKLDPASLRARYLTSDPAFTKLRILDTQIEMATQTSALLRQKANRLKSAAVALALAVVALAVGSLLTF